MSAHIQHAQLKIVLKDFHERLFHQAMTSFQTGLNGNSSDSLLKDATIIGKQKYLSLVFFKTGETVT